MTDRKKLIDDAEDILGISICRSAGGRLAYQDEGMRTWYWIALSDLHCARDFASNADDDMELCDSPYSHWCAATPCKEVKTCETQLGLSLSCKCERESRRRCANR